MKERLYFNELAKQLGVETGEHGDPSGMPSGAPGGMPPMGGAPGGMPPMGGAPGGMPPMGGAPGGQPPMGGAPSGQPPMGGAAMVHPNVWRTEGGLKALEYLKRFASPGEYFEYDGHADCWLMLAIMYQLRMCDINTYIGAFDKTLKITTYAVGKDPVPGQPANFELIERGDDCLLKVNLDPDKGPFDMPFSQVVAPLIPEGKNIYVRLNGRHLLFTFPVSMTYGDKCRSIIMNYSDELFCSVSNTPEFKVGQLIEKNPFKDIK